MISSVIGLPGSGKSVFLVKCAELALKGRPCRVGGYQLHHGDYEHVLTNFPMQGCERLEWDLLGKTELRNSLIICDEIMMFANSRKFKEFSDEHTFFFAEHRKFGCDFIWASQTYRDCDLRIRNLTQRFYFCEPAPIFSKHLSVISPIIANIRVDGDITESYELAPLVQRSLCFLPKYWNKFDTNEIIGYKNKELSEYPLTKW